MHPHTQGLPSTQARRNTQDQSRRASFTKTERYLRGCRDHHHGPVQAKVLDKGQETIRMMTPTKKNLWKTRTMPSTIWDTN